MGITLFDTRRRKKSDFIPNDSSLVKIYVCGITPYGPSHLGHARCYIVFDILIRWLKSRGYNIQYVRNFTDIDDKIIAKALEENVEYSVISERYIHEYSKNMRELNVLEPNEEPKVTETIPEIIKLIEINYFLPC